MIMTVNQATLPGQSASPRNTSPFLNSSVIERVRQLTARYPNVSASEAAEILQFVRTARYAEIGLLASDESLRRQLDHFIRSHKRELRWSMTDWAVLIGLLIAILAVCWLLWSPLS
jgi:hypothetical protein